MGECCAVADELLVLSEGEVRMKEQRRLFVREDDGWQLAIGNWQGEGKGESATILTEQPPRVGKISRLQADLPERSKKRGGDSFA